MRQGALKVKLGGNTERREKRREIAKVCEAEISKLWK